MYLVLISIAFDCFIQEPLRLCFCDLITTDTFMSAAKNILHKLKSSYSDAFDNMRASHGSAPAFQLHHYFNPVSRIARRHSEYRSDVAESLLWIPDTAMAEDHRGERPEGSSSLILRVYGACNRLGLDSYADAAVGVLAAGIGPAIWLALTALSAVDMYLPIAIVCGVFIIFLLVEMSRRFYQKYTHAVYISTDETKDEFVALQNKLLHKPRSAAPKPVELQNKKSVRKIVVSSADSLPQNNDMVTPAQLRDLLTDLDSPSAKPLAPEERHPGITSSPLGDSSGGWVSALPFSGAHHTVFCGDGFEDDYDGVFSDAGIDEVTENYEHPNSDNAVLYEISAKSVKSGDIQADDEFDYFTSYTTGFSVHDSASNERKKGILKLQTAVHKPESEISTSVIEEDKNENDALSEYDYFSAYSEVDKLSNFVDENA